MVESVYIHIPFCTSICSYCDFCKVFYQEHLADKYLDSLRKEIEKRYRNETIRTLYIGGGTPSSLSVSLLKKLFSICSIFSFALDCEITMEANVEHLTEEKIKLMKAFGINRVSLGVETVNETLQSLLERKNSKEKIRQVIACLRNNGILNINVDLIYAIPGETEKDLKQDLEFLLSLQVPHISTYSLILEEHTKLKINHKKAIDPDLDFSMYQIICQVLKQYGYCHYEVSNFAKKGFYSRHNLVYWENNYYYGFGVGASSYLSNYRMTNKRSLTKYLNGEFLFEKEILTLEDQYDYEVLLRLRLEKGIDKEKFAEKYHHSLSEIYNYHDLVVQKILEESNQYVRVAPSYFYVLNEVIVKFLCCKNSLR